jgi:hypothetical protein
MTARDVFEVVSDFFEEHSIKWKNMLCTEPLPCWFAGLELSFNKTVAANAIGTHCVIYRQMLAAKTLLSGLKQIIQAVNFIKSSVLSSGIVSHQTVLSN